MICKVLIFEKVVIVAPIMLCLESQLFAFINVIDGHIQRVVCCETGLQ